MVIQVIFCCCANRIQFNFIPNYPIKVSTSYVVKIDAPNAVAVNLTIIPCNPIATAVNLSEFSIIKCKIQLPCYSSPATAVTI